MYDENLIEKKIDSQCIYDGKVLHVFCDKIELPNGNAATREYAKHIGAVAVVPLTDEGEVLCVRQFRYPLRRVILEIPAGKLDSYTEDFREAALRELREETGATCDRLDYIGDLVTTPALIDEVIHLYLARGLTFGETDFDDDEFLDVVKVPLDTLVDMIMDGRIKDAKTQTAILKTRMILDRENNNKGRETK